MGVFAGYGTRAKGVTISFGERFAASDQFDAIFREGMALVERTAAYLDGPGRKEAKALPGPAAMLYASESMRLTTRLLELA
jgi:regulator of CtrA degradation